jgi:hypothetical protein
MPQALACPHRAALAQPVGSEGSVPSRWNRVCRLETDGHENNRKARDAFDKTKGTAKF